MRSCGPTPFNLPPQGDPGVPGPSGDYGYIRYAGSMAQTPLALAFGQRTQLIVTLDQTQTIDQLQEPFVGHSFWDGTTLRSLAPGDHLFLRLGFVVIPTVSGGDILVQTQIANGPIVEESTRELPSQAGTMQRLNYIMSLFSRPDTVVPIFSFFLTASVPTTITGPNLLIEPLHSGSPT